jgi:hypothetical protein
LEWKRRAPPAVGIAGFARRGSPRRLPDGQISEGARDLHVQPRLQKYFCFSEI